MGYLQMIKGLFLAMLAGLSVMSAGCAYFTQEGVQCREMDTFSAACLKYSYDHGKMPPERPDALKPDYLPADFQTMNYKIMVSDPLQFTRPGNVVLCNDTRMLSSGRKVVAFADGKVEVIELSALKPMAALTLSCMTYAGRHKKFPARLEDLKAAGYLAPNFNLEPYELMVKGRPDDIRNPAETVILREKLLSDGGRRVVAYADSHIELWRE